MARTDRLLDLLQILRRHQFAVSGQTLASELGVSLRTIYRDILTLQNQGVPIDGEAGIGYLLRAGYTIPPLMFTINELEAIVLGIRWASLQGDAGLVAAGRDVLAKINAMVPPALRRELEATTLMVASKRPAIAMHEFAAPVRAAIRGSQVVEIEYRDKAGNPSRRRIWPFAIGYFDQAQIIAAWCETRQDFRHFRTDQIQTMRLLDEPYPTPRLELFEEWRRREGIAASATLLGE